MSPVIRRVMNPSEAEIDNIVQTFHEAFNRSFFIETCGGDSTLCVPLIKAHVVNGFLEGNEVWVSETENREIASASVWFGPGNLYMDTKEIQDKCGWTAVMEMLPKEGSEAWMKFLDEYKVFSEVAYGPGVKRAGYHLQLFGTNPKYHKQGHGRGMVAAVQEKAKKEGVRVCVETTHTTALLVYKALGFIRLEETLSSNLGKPATVWAFITPS